MTVLCTQSVQSAPGGGQSLCKDPPWAHCPLATFWSQESWWQVWPSLKGGDSGCGQEAGCGVSWRPPAPVHAGSRRGCSKLMAFGLPPTASQPLVQGGLGSEATCLDSWVHLPSSIQGRGTQEVPV